jgi:membrane-bound lytic murein transglycosylase F
LAEELAADLGLEMQIVWVDSEAEALAYVLDGRSDITLGRPARGSTEAPDGAAFTLPASIASGHIVTRTDDELAEPTGLAGRRVAVPASSPFLPDLLSLLEIADFVVDTVPETVHPEEMIHRIAMGRYDVGVVESDVVEAAFAYRDDLRIAFSLPNEVRHAALVRSTATELRRAADQFLVRVIAEGGAIRRYQEDLEELKDRGVLRVITVNGPSTYFLWRGDVVGFDYEFVKKFATEQKLRVRVVVASTMDQVLPWLAEGRGDLVAVGLGPEAASVVEGLSRTSVVHDVAPVVLARAGEGPITQASDLAGRSVVMRASSPYITVVDGFRDSVSFSLESVTAPISTSGLVDGVANGEYDLTVLPSHLADLELAGRDDVVSALRVENAGGLAWVVRDDQPQLLAALDDFLVREVGGLFYNVLLRKYFRRDTRIIVEDAYDPAADGLSPFDDIAQKYSAQYEFDWRAITAQMYVESRFDPEAVSSFGATGLMQVMPATAAEVGLTRLTDPDEGLHAGVKYMDWVRARFEEEEIALTDRLAFALAAYNAGYGHVSDARQVAERMGLDRNRWFENVELAMLRLSDPAVYRTVPRGYARGSEPVNYVRKITELGALYLRVTEAEGP